MTPGIASPNDLELLARLGFAPNAPLMNEPHVLVNHGYLDRLRRELDESLGNDMARRVQSQIGLFHGLREGRRAVNRARHDVSRATSSRPDTPSIAMTLLGHTGHRDLTVHGRWPRTIETTGATRSSGDANTGDCPLTAGYTSGWLSEIFGSTLVAVETACRSRGDAFCAFAARPEDGWQARGDTRAVQLARELPFDTFRELLRERPEPASGADTAVTTAYAWGPVLILPFQASPVSLAKLEPVPGVRVVVVDFRGLVFDRTDPITAIETTRLHASLEALLDSLGSWGAEPILTAPPAPLASRLGQLGGGPYLTRSTLAEALATAFQIARAQDTTGRAER